jgi:hypothetical protein
MDRYKNGKIYKIVDNSTGEIYIGSTCEPTLAHRLSKHKACYKRYLTGAGCFITSYNILQNNNYSIVLLEDFPCERKDQLLARERFYIENNKCVNKFVPTRTHKEYQEQNKDKIKEYQKEWYEQNKDKIKDKQKEYQEQNKDKIKEYQKEWYEQNKDKQKEYQEQNKEKIKEYREQNKEKIKEYKEEKFNCECGGCYRRSDKARHFKTKKHLDYFTTLNEIS